MAQPHQSEVARMRAQIKAEYASAWNALHGPATGVAQHRIINAKLSRVDELSEQLIARIGKDAALTIIVSIMQDEKGQE